ncbi:hypothetical protein [uncultured Gimesia sp.]
MCRPAWRHSIWHHNDKGSSETISHFIIQPEPSSRVPPLGLPDGAGTS